MLQLFTGGSKKRMRMIRNEIYTANFYMFVQKAVV